MKYKDKSKEQRTNESAETLQPVEDLTARETGRRQAEEALKRSEILYRSLFETAQDGILLLDADAGQILDVNPFLLKMLGYSHKDFLGKKLWEIGPFSDDAASQLRFSELQTKGYVRYEHISGYKKALGTLYSPKHYYKRVRTFLGEFIPPDKKKKALRFRPNIGTFFRSIVVLGVFGKERFYYWRLLFWTVITHPRLLPQAVTLSIYGFSFPEDL